MKVKVRSRGETEFDLDAEYQEPAIREAIEDGCNDIPSAIVDYTDTERSNISHDEHATVTEDDGTVLWSGWLHGDPGDDDSAAEILKLRSAVAELLDNTGLDDDERARWLEHAGIAEADL